MKRKGSQRLLRIRNKPLKRTRPLGFRTIIRLLLIFIPVFLVFWGIHHLFEVVTTSESLVIKNVVVLGDYPNRDEIKREVEGYCLKKFKSTQPNIFKFNIEDLRRHLGSLPKVEEVKIRKQFPETIFIEIKTRIPIAFILYQGSILGCDKERIFKLEAPSKYNLPFITGVTEIEKERIRQATKIAFEMKEMDLLSLVSEINIKDPKNFSVYTLNNTKIYLGVINYDLRERLAKLKEILDYTERASLPIKYINLGFERIVIKPRGGFRDSPEEI